MWAKLITYHAQSAQSFSLPLIRQILYEYLKKPAEELKPGLSHQARVESQDVELEKVDDKLEVGFVVHALQQR